MDSSLVKQAVAPIQMWLLSQNRCVGCGKELTNFKHKKHPKGEMVTCECGRIFIKEKNGKYRRALHEEV
jgi:DNA-directed RNA polymerase subunit RPC12/RpoP